MGEKRRVERSWVCIKGFLHPLQNHDNLDYPEWIGDKLIHSENGWVIVTDSYYDIENNSFWELPQKQ